jgi:hypothetical protein
MVNVKESSPYQTLGALKLVEKSFKIFQSIYMQMILLEMSQKNGINTFLSTLLFLVFLLTYQTKNTTVTFYPLPTGPHF